MVYEKVLITLALLKALGVIDGSSEAELARMLTTTVATSTPSILATNAAAIAPLTQAAAPMSIPARTSSDVYQVPFYSQLEDITSPTWQKVGCGIASLAMLIDFHKQRPVDVDSLLRQGIDAGAYLSGKGWTYAGLIGVAHAYGLTGKSYDLAGSTLDTAFAEFTKAVKEAPVIASVHYTFDPANPIPHLVVVRGIEGDTLYYNDPALRSAGGSISVTQFKKAWKKRYIEFWPVS